MIKLGVNLTINSFNTKPFKGNGNVKPHPNKSNESQFKSLFFWSSSGMASKVISNVEKGFFRFAHF